MFPDVLKGFSLLALIFIPLERGFGLHKQLIFRRGWTTDTLYFVFGNLIGKAAGVVIPAVLAFSFLNRFTGSEWQAAISSQPIFLQFIEVIVFAEIGYYFAHRMLHEVPFLWQFHAKEEGISTQNFAAQCPFMDLLLGTFYLPKNRIPTQYGIPEPVPMGYVGQLFYPFQFKGKRMIKFFQSPLLRQLRPFLVGVGISVLGVGTLTIGAIAHRMDLPTFASSWTVPKVTAQELQQGHLENIILVDVRTPQEHAEDRIAGSVLVPLSEIESGLGVHKIVQLAQTASQSEPTIVLYCAAGARSVKAYRKLEQMGLNVVSLAGGINAWRKIVPVSYIKSA